MVVMRWLCCVPVGCVTSVGFVDCTHGAVKCVISTLYGCCEMVVLCECVVMCVDLLIARMVPLDMSPEYCIGVMRL
jgi:hypothetical protein